MSQAFLENKILTMIRKLIKNYYLNYYECMDCEKIDKQVRVNMPKCSNIECNEYFTRKLTSK